MVDKGFTLIEVLVALVVFAIAFLGLYALLNQSLVLQSSSWSRLNLILETTHFVVERWDSSFEETPGWVGWKEGIEYRVEKEPVGFYGITKVYCSFRDENEAITYVFYY